MMMGPAEKQPMATRHMPRYCAWKLWWTVSRIARPAMVIRKPRTIKGRRRRRRSERKAKMRHKANAAAAGGTVCSWVSTVE